MQPPANRSTSGSRHGLLRRADPPGNPLHPQRPVHRLRRRGLVDQTGNPVLGQAGARSRSAPTAPCPRRRSAASNSRAPSSRAKTSTRANLRAGRGAVRSGRARGLRRRRRAGDDRDDRLPAQLPVRPAGDPGDRPDEQQASTQVGTLGSGADRAASPRSSSPFALPITGEQGMDRRARYRPAPRPSTIRT